MTEYDDHDDQELPALDTADELPELFVGRPAAVDELPEDVRLDDPEEPEEEEDW